MIEKNINDDKLTIVNNSETHPKKPTRIYERIKEDDFVKILGAYKQKNLYPHIVALLLAYGSGLRLQETLNIKPEDIDIESRNVHVRQGKGSKDRHTILIKQFKKDYLSYMPIQLTKKGIQSMFLKITLSLKLNNIIDTYTLKSGKTRNIYRYHFHSLRHSFAHNCLAQGVPLNVVQEFLGHKHISTTGVYTKLSGDDAIAIALSRGL